MKSHRTLGAVHSKQGYLIILMAVSLSVLDILAAIRRFGKFLRSSDRSLRTFWRLVVRKEEELGTGPEYVGLVGEPEGFEPSKGDTDSVELQDIPLTDDSTRSHTQQWANDVHQHRRHYSLASERTIFDTHSPHHSDDTLNNPKSRHGRSLLQSHSLVCRIGQGAFAVTERALVLAGLGQLLIGIVTYTGEAHI